MNLVLAVGDFCNCLAIMLLGTTRYEIYTRALEEKVVPVEVSGQRRNDFVATECEKCLKIFEER